MKKAVILMTVHNVYWGIVQIYKAIEYICSIDQVGENLALESFLKFSAISLIIVFPLNIIQFFVNEKQSLWSQIPYLISVVFVLIAYLLGLVFILL